MAFVRSKIHKNKNKPPRVYYFLVKNYRQKGKKTPKQAHVAFLGRYGGEPSKDQLTKDFPQHARLFEEYFHKRELKADKALKKAKSHLDSARSQLESLQSDYEQHLNS